MKSIYALLILACAISFSSCDIESNASYTGNYYSYNKKDSQYPKQITNTGNYYHPEYSDLEYKARQEHQLYAQQTCQYKDGGYASGAVYHPGNIPCNNCGK